MLYFVSCSLNLRININNLFPYLTQANIILTF